MNSEQFRFYVGGMLSDLSDTKIVFLDDNSHSLKLINEGTIPAFENAGGLVARKKKDQGLGKFSMERRPYLICYNKILRCNVLYVMTGGLTRDDIRNKMYYDAIETPRSLYRFIDSSVMGGLDRDTHTEDNISTLSVIRAIPISEDMLDQDESIMHKASFDADNIDLKKVHELREYLSNFYGNERGNHITKAVLGGHSAEWFTDLTDKVSYHKMSRPSAMYVAMFINYSMSLLDSKKEISPLMLTQLKGLTAGATSAYLECARLKNALDGVRRSHPIIYREYMQLKNDTARSLDGRDYSDVFYELLAGKELKESAVKKIKGLFEVESQINKNLSLVSNAIVTFFNSIPKKINISNAKMSKSLFEGLDKIAKASDSKYAEQSEAWNSAIAERFDKRITDTKTMLYERKLSKEREDHRRRVERAKAEQIIESRTERIKLAVQDAIRLYNELYKDSFTALEEGTLFSKTIQGDARQFIKLFSTYQDGSSLSFKKLLDESQGRDAQSYMAKRIVAMADFLPNVESASEGITESTKAQEMQQYAKSKTQTIGGDEGESVMRAIDLMEIVHEEFSKAKKFKRASQDKSPVEIIIEKALKDKNRFANVDFSEGSSAKAYFDEMLLVSEYQNQLSNVINIYNMRLRALRDMQDIERGYSILLCDYDIIKEKLTGTGVFAEDVKAKLEKPTEDEFLSEIESHIMAIINDKGLSAIETASKVEEYTKSVVAEIEKERKAILNFANTYNSAQVAYSDYITKYEEDELHLEKMIASAKQRVGFGADEGFVHGVLSGKMLNMIKDVRTGESSVEQDEESRDLEDKDFVLQMFGRTIPQPGDIELQAIHSIAQSNDIFEVTNALADFSRTAKDWASNLDESYDAVRKLYLQLLIYRKKIEGICDGTKEFCRNYVANINPLSSYDGKPYLDEESLSVIRKYGADAIEAYCADLDQYYKAYAMYVFVSDVVNYFNKIETRADASVPAYDYVNIGRVAKNIFLQTLFEDDNKNALDVFNTADEELEELKRLVESAPFCEYIATPEFNKNFYYLMPILDFEISSNCLKSISSTYFASDNEGADSESTRRGEMTKALNRLMTNTGNGFTQSDALYEYLLERLPKFKEFIENSYKKIGKGRIGREDGNALYNQSLTRLANLEHKAMVEYNVKDDKEKAERCAGLYRFWLSRLYGIEKAREERGLYLKKEGRDLETEQKILKGEFDFAVSGEEE